MNIVRSTFLVIAVMSINSCTLHKSSIPGTDLNPGRTREFTHKASGMTFPNAIGEFTRGRVHEHDDKGYNISVGYDSDSFPLVTITVYVYPVDFLPPIGLSSEARAAYIVDQKNRMYIACKHDISNSHNDAILVGEEEIQYNYDDSLYSGTHATYEFSVNHSGYFQPKISHWIFFPYVSDPWIVQYRITHNRDSSSSKARYQMFLDSFRWSFKG